MWPKVWRQGTSSTPHSRAWASSSRISRPENPPDPRADPGVALEPEGVLGVEHQFVVAEPGEQLDQPLDRLDGGNPSPGDVEQETAAPEGPGPSRITAADELGERLGAVAEAGPRRREDPGAARVHPELERFRGGRLAPASLGDAGRPVNRDWKRDWGTSARTRFPAPPSGAARPVFSPAISIPNPTRSASREERIPAAARSAGVPLSRRIRVAGSGRKTPGSRAAKRGDGSSRRRGRGRPPPHSTRWYPPGGTRWTTAFEPFGNRGPRRIVGGTGDGGGPRHRAHGERVRPRGRRAGPRGTPDPGHSHFPAHRAPGAFARDPAGGFRRGGFGGPGRGRRR